MFKKRLLTSYQFNFKLWKSIVDWTVFAYIFIPGCIIAVFLYRDFLKNLQPIVIDSTFILLPLLIISFFISKSTIRFFIYDADLLFLYQNSKKIKHLKRAAIIYSFLHYNISIALILGIVTPILFSIGLTFLDICKIILLFNLLSTILILLNYLYRSLVVRLPILLGVHCLLVFNFFAIPIVIYIIGFVICGIFLLKKVYSNRFWSTEIVWEYEAFNKWMKIIFTLNHETRYYLPQKSKAPVFIFAKNRKFSRYRIDNLIYKTLLRKFNYISLPLRLILLCFGLLFILPSWGKVVVMIITVLGLFTAMDSILKEIKQAPFFQLTTISEEQWYTSKLRIQKRLLYPVIGFLLMIFFIV